MKKLQADALAVSMAHAPTYAARRVPIGGRTIKRFTNADEQMKNMTRARGELRSRTRVHTIAEADVVVDNPCTFAYRFHIVERNASCRVVKRSAASCRTKTIVYRRFLVYNCAQRTRQRIAIDHF